jgi:hypothetical protein
MRTGRENRIFVPYEYESLRRAEISVINLSGLQRDAFSYKKIYDSGKFRDLHV